MRIIQELIDVLLLRWKIVFSCSSNMYPGMNYDIWENSRTGERREVRHYDQVEGW